MSGSTRPCQAKHATLLGGTDRSSPRSHLFQFHLTRLQAANLPGAFLAHIEGSSPCQAMQVLGEKRELFRLGWTSSREWTPTERARVADKGLALLRCCSAALCRISCALQVANCG